MNHIPRVSIGMPVYNGEKFIRDALDSLLAQTYTDFELIISDNASTDVTEKICREYATKDSRVHYIRQGENIGATENFKFVLQMARGEYFMWAAHDDRWHPDFIYLGVRVLDDDPSCGLVFCEFETKNLVTGTSTRSCVGMYNSDKPYRNWFMRNLSPCPNLIYGLQRRSILEQLEIKSYDFFDIYLSTWYSVKSRVKIIPLNLFVAGVKGKRVPYSATGRYIDCSQFLREEWKLLRKSTNLVIATILYSLLLIHYTFHTRRLNKIIKEESDYET